MDVDPELAVTLTNGRRVLVFSITTTTDGTWRVRAPGVAQIVRDAPTAIAIRDLLDRQIARQLAAGWVPADPVTVTPIALPPDVALQITALLESLARARGAIRAVDPTEALLRASETLRAEARRVGLDVPNPWILRAQDSRRLGELADARGDLAAAIVYYRAAIAAHRRVGVARRLAQLERYTTNSPRSRASDAAPENVYMRGKIMTTPRVQIVGRLPADLHRRVRAAAATAKESLNAFLIAALTQAVRSKKSRA
jgi:hypothetical protein